MTRPAALAAMCALTACPTAALDRWPDGEPIRWRDAKPRGRPQMPLLYVAERQAGRDTHTVRANRLRGNLVYHVKVSPGP